MSLQNGYAGDTMDVDKSIDRLENHIGAFTLRMKELSSEELLHRQAEGKWSKKEILGHLIDSAINNLKRFTDAQFSSLPYVVVKYQQAELVAVNNYQDLPLDHLLALWQSLNRQIVFVVRNIDNEKLNYAVDPQYHNGELKTLGWIIVDYVAHMEHHFKQIQP
ncbi:MAG TPA: DinB family protein [Chitinophagaceae bacterium]|nr:DinB family protein [Chitinophagaceae bacterium]